MNEKKYRCRFCKHCAIEYDAFVAMGDTHLSERWICDCRDDERCVPGCELFERKKVDA